MKREFIILPEFDRCWGKMGLDDGDLRELENYLCAHPESGDVAPGTGGLRKLRWGAQGKGKRGGARVIYVDFAYYEKIYLLSAYPKSVKVNLTETEKAEIKRLIKILEHELRTKRY
jgi:hypothetical protein